MNVKTAYSPFALVTLESAFISCPQSTSLAVSLRSMLDGSRCPHLSSCVLLVWVEFFSALLSSVDLCLLSGEACGAPWIFRLVKSLDSMGKVLFAPDLQSDLHWFGERRVARPGSSDRSSDLVGRSVARPDLRL